MRAAQDDLPLVMETDQATVRQADWGGMIVSREAGCAGMDSAPIFASLPGGRCPCPHWGYVVRGRMVVSYADREEVLHAGDAYHLEPGHTARIEEDGEIVEFSPAEELRAVMAQVMEGAQA